MSLKRIFIVALAVAATSSGCAEAAAVLGSNGHYYDYVSDSLTFDQAVAAAAATVGPNGQKGYLATITSPDEQALVQNLAAHNAMVWAGGSDADKEGTWRWITGPEAGQIFYTGHYYEANACAGYCNWLTNEPNELGDEDALVVNWNQGRWNDQSGSVTHGYFIEFGGLSSAVPEPAIWAMMIGGFGMVGGSMRYRRLQTKTTFATA